MIKDDILYLHAILIQSHALTPVVKFSGILGGKYNDFTDLSAGAATGFEWQHDARWNGTNRITLFNNAANGAPYLVTNSHGLLLELDIPAREAKVVTKYEHPLGIMAVSQGNLQVLDTGNVLVGWGHSAAFTEFKSLR